LYASVLKGSANLRDRYDLAVIGKFHGYDAFRKSFGTEIDGDGNPRISPAWQAGIQNGAQAGSIIGLCINGYISELWGFKRTMYVSLFAAVLFNSLHFFARDLNGFLAGSVLLGLPWGVFQALTVTYASDITPSALRPYLTTYINMCWVFGQLSAAGILRACHTLDSAWGWRIPIALQWAWVPCTYHSWL
jgi:SP family general alpha glucoside:H+ symporter-like MFS transporter